MQITKLMTDANSDQSINEVRNHLIDLYTRIGVGLLKSHQNLIEQLVSSDNQWQETVDQLIDELTQVKDDKERKEHEL